MHFSKSAVLIVFFATSAICAPLAQSDSLDIGAPEISLGGEVSDGIQIVPRILSAGQMTVQYHAAENTATAALGQAQNLDTALHGAHPTAVQQAQMNAYILQAWRSGHE